MGTAETAALGTTDLGAAVAEARSRTLDLMGDLGPDALLGPELAIVNPPLWEAGHVAWFQEKWVLRPAAGPPPIHAESDALYDSSAIAHDLRWNLPLFTRDGVFRYLEEVRDRVLERLAGGREPSAAERYFVLLSVFHEDMHTEAFTYTRQTLGQPAPRFLAAAPDREGGGPLPGDAEVPGGLFKIGAVPGDEPFVFDNEKWAHAREVRPFRIARAPVTQAELRAWVEDGGYRRRELWSEDGWQWREGAAAETPVHWRREPGGSWLRRDFDRWVPLEPHRPALHVSWHEAEAWCRWARRRLPTELEWEVAASAEPSGLALSRVRRRFPWGSAPPTPERANLDWRAAGCLDVGALPAGDSPWGCRQMIGNVWEWTASDFLPYPGFEADPYRDYSQPWFGPGHKVLRGGAWTTRARLLRNTWRNFYPPDRRDVWAGFRTCAVED
jgi:iron(II)-dependent oxidoreductase